MTAAFPFKTAPVDHGDGDGDGPGIDLGPVPPVRPDPATLGAAWWRAVRGLNRARVEALLAQGVDPYRPHKDGYTALGWLAQGQVPMQRLNDAAALAVRLVAAGVDPLREEPSGAVPPLVQALQTAQRSWPAADPGLAHAMIRAMTWSSDPRDPRAGTALRAAIQERLATGTVAVLLEQGVSPQTFGRPSPALGIGQPVSALGVALRHGRTEDLIVLLHAGATLCEAEWDNEQDPYMLAAVTQAMPAEKKVDHDLRRRTHLLALLDHHVPMGEVGRRRVMPLVARHACVDPDLLDRLHAHGAAWDGTLRDGQTALHMVMEHPAPDALLDHLLQQGLSPLARTTRGATPIDRLRKQVEHRPALTPLLARLESRVLADVLNGSESDGPAPVRPGRARL